mmetsp:Transcript_15099/g.26786  ORF Transcript_15099/g.26786 Transcript_15099/m.26786 type:complete len:566 (-) Transcript_15099:1070-2767(-)
MQQMRLSSSKLLLPKWHLLQEKFLISQATVSSPNRLLSLTTVSESNEKNILPLLRQRNFPHTVPPQVSGNSLQCNVNFRRKFCGWANQSVTGSPEEITSGHSQEDDVRLDAKMVFDACWRRFEEKYDMKDIHIPREIIWLNGAPGSGKGANAKHLLKIRGLDHSICISDLLATYPHTRSMMERGELIHDGLIGDILLESLMGAGSHFADPSVNVDPGKGTSVDNDRSLECGILVDGFPRTALQVDFLKLFHDKLQELHLAFASTIHESQFPRPLFKVVMLYVDEETSIRRQLARAQIASVHNKRVIDAGAGQLWEERATDLSIEKCKKRYAIFREHHTSVLRLKQFFPFHLIDSMGSLVETQAAITNELRYQSSLDLSYETYAAIRKLPLASSLTQYARQQLVARLDDHCEKYPDLFHNLIQWISTVVLPIVLECGLAGRAEIITDDKTFSNNPRAIQIVIDVLTDRGFYVSHHLDKRYKPVRVDFTTGLIESEEEVQQKFTVSWEVKGVRDMVKAMEVAAKMQNESSTHMRISSSYVPTHINKELPVKVPSKEELLSEEALTGY